MTSFLLRANELGGLEATGAMGDRPQVPRVERASDRVICRGDWEASVPVSLANFRKAEIQIGISTLCYIFCLFFEQGIYAWWTNFF